MTVPTGLTLHNRLIRVIDYSTRRSLPRIENVAIDLAIASVVTISVNALVLEILRPYDRNTFLYSLIYLLLDSFSLKYSSVLGRIVQLDGSDNGISEEEMEAIFFQGRCLGALLCMAGAAAVAMLFDLNVIAFFTCFIPFICHRFFKIDYRWPLYLRLR